MTSKHYAEFDEALHALPKNDLNKWIRFDSNDGEVKMSLEAFLAIAENFKGHIQYGLISTHESTDGKVYELPFMPFKDARDLAEMTQGQLMQKFESDWIEA